MPFNASGLFERLYSWINDRDAGIKILASRMDAEMDGMAAAINDLVEGDIDWQGPMRGAFGTAAAPSWSFAEDSDSGLYRISADSVGISAGGSKVLEIGAEGVGTIDGSESAPAFAFIGDTDTGLYRIGADTIGISAGGVKVVDIGVNGVGSALPVSIPDGSELAPSLTFADDADTGVYRIADNNLGISVGGSKVLDLDSTKIEFTTQALISNGTSILPGMAIGVVGTGISRSSGSGNIHVSLDGTEYLFLSTTLFGPATTNTLSLGSDSYRWKGVYCENGSAAQVALSTGTNNTGFFRESSSGNLKAVRSGIEVWSASGSSFASELARTNTTATGANARIDPSSGAFQRSTSARKYKQDIIPISDGEILAFLSISGVTFRSKIETDDSSVRHFGIIADDAHEAGLNALVSYGATGEIEGFQYDRSVPILLEIVKQLSRRIEALEAT